MRSICSLTGLCGIALFTGVALAPSIAVRIESAIVLRVPLSLPHAFPERLPVVVVTLAPSPLHRDHGLRRRKTGCTRDHRRAQQHCSYVLHIPSR